MNTAVNTVSNTLYSKFVFLDSLLKPNTELSRASYGPSREAPPTLDSVGLSTLLGAHAPDFYFHNSKNRRRISLTPFEASADSYTQCGKAVTGIDRAARRVFGKLKTFCPREEFLERHAHLESRQRGSQAKMDALAPD